MIDVNISGIVVVEMKDEDNQIVASESDSLIKVYCPQDVEVDDGAFLDDNSSSAGKVVFETIANGDKIKFLMNIADVRRVVKFLEG